MALETFAIVIRMALYFSLLPLFGVAVFGSNGLRGAEPSGDVFPLRPGIMAMTLVGLAASGAQIVVMAASMAGIPLHEVDATLLGNLINATPIGLAWKARILVLVVILPLLLMISGKPQTALTLVTGLAGVASATLAWTGHGAMDEGALGWIHLAGDIVHLLAAGAWIGAIVSLGWLLLRYRPDCPDRLTLLSRALRNFASTGTIIVSLILASGIANCWILVGPSNLLTVADHLYGQLLLVKIGLFVAMLGLAALNRFKLTPALGVAAPPYQAFVALRRSLAFEVGCAFLILAIVACLGTLDPIGSPSL